MANTQQIEAEITEWAKVNHPETYPNFYSAWEVFKDVLSHSDISLPSGLAKEITRFTRDGSKQDESIYFTVIFAVQDEHFKVDGYYDSWNGEGEDLPAVEKISQPSFPA